VKGAICILGGMGPQASSYMYKLLIDKAASEYGAKNNEDFPEIIVHSVPVPDFISDSKNKEKALSILRQRIKMLNKVNVSSFAIACNTAHILLNDLSAVSRKPFVSMIDAVVDEVSKTGYTKVGLLGSPSTLRSGIYQIKFANKKIGVVISEETDILVLEKIIRKVISNSTEKEDLKRLLSISNRLKLNGAQCIVLGCTELPLVFPRCCSLPVLNSVEVLSNKLLNNYYPKIMKA